MHPLIKSLCTFVGRVVCKQWAQITVLVVAQASCSQGPLQIGRRPAFPILLFSLQIKNSTKKCYLHGPSHHFLAIFFPSSGLFVLRRLIPTNETSSRYDFDRKSQSNIHLCFFILHPSKKCFFFDPFPIVEHASKSLLDRKMNCFADQLPFSIELLRYRLLLKS